jgi:hypothetical protein
VRSQAEKLSRVRREAMALEMMMKSRWIEIWVEELQDPPSILVVREDRVSGQITICDPGAKYREVFKGSSRGQLRKGSSRGVNPEQVFCEKLGVFNRVYCTPQ